MDAIAKRLRKDKARAHNQIMTDQVLSQQKIPQPKGVKQTAAGTRAIYKPQSKASMALGGAETAARVVKVIADTRHKEQPHDTRTPTQTANPTRKSLAQR